MTTSVIKTAINMGPALKNKQTKKTRSKKLYSKGNRETTNNPYEKR